MFALVVRFYYEIIFIKIYSDVTAYATPKTGFSPSEMVHYLTEIALVQGIGKNE